MPYLFIAATFAYIELPHAIWYGTVFRVGTGMVHYRVGDVSLLQFVRSALNVTPSLYLITTSYPVISEP